MLKLLRAYLNAGVMQDGVKVPQEEGTPQGSPLSPLLANIMLDDLDQELDRPRPPVRPLRGRHHDLREERAGGRAGDGEHQDVRREAAEAPGERGRNQRWLPATSRPFLGFGFFIRDGEVKVRLDPKAKAAAKMRLRRLTGRSWRVSMAVRIAALNRFIAGLDGLLRPGRHPFGLRRTRRMAAQTAPAGALEGVEEAEGRYRGLVARGIPAWQAAMGGFRPGLLARRRLGHPRPRPSRCLLADIRVWLDFSVPTVSFGMLGEPPDAGPHVRWCGRGRGEPGPYPAPTRFAPRLYDRPVLGSSVTPGARRKRSL